MQSLFCGFWAAGKETAVMARPLKYSPELRRRAVIEVIERNRSIVEVARDLGIGSPETLRNWVRQARRDAGLEVGPTTEELAEIKRLRREVADQQRTIEILKAATLDSSGQRNTMLESEEVANGEDGKTVNRPGFYDCSVYWVTASRAACV